MGRDEVGVIHRSVAVLHLLVDAPGGLALSEVASRIGCPKASAHRLLANLEAVGLVCQAGYGQVYRVGPTLLQLAGTYLHHLDVQEAARPYLDRLRLESGETASLHVLMDGGVVCVAIRESPYDLRLSGRIGTTVALGRGANGKLLMAFSPEAGRESELEALAEVRRLGFAATCNERVPGAWSIAAPVFNVRGEVLASISLRGPTTRFTAADGALNTRQLKAAARELSVEMGAVRLPDEPDLAEIDAAMRKLELSCRGTSVDARPSKAASLERK